MTNANVQTPKKFGNQNLQLHLGFGVWFSGFFSLVIRIVTPASTISAPERFPTA
jgi:hypothetical protein